MALAIAYHEDAPPEWVRWDAAVRAAAADLFPDRAGRRGAGWSMVAFNDHPDTTLADVELVVKEAERRLPWHAPASSYGSS